MFARRTRLARDASTILRTHAVILASALIAGTLPVSVRAKYSGDVATYLASDWQPMANLALSTVAFTSDVSISASSLMASMVEMEP